MAEYKQMKLMADYQCWCLWDMDSSRNINPDSLPISNELKLRLHEWQRRFDQTLDLQDQTNIGFKSDSDYQEFYEYGWILLESLRVEMKDTEWWYRDRRFSGLQKTRPTH